MLLLLDPASWVAIGTAVASAYSSFRTNKQRKKLANTAVQRRADDLRAAGFNPVLAAGGPAASSPDLKDPGAAAATGAQASSAVNLIRMQTQKLRAETQNIGVNTRIGEERWKWEQLKGGLGEGVMDVKNNFEAAMDNPAWADWAAKNLMPRTEGNKIKLPAGIGKMLKGFKGNLGPFKPVPGKRYYPSRGDTIPPGVKVKPVMKMINDRPVLQYYEVVKRKKKGKGYKGAVTRSF